MVSAVLLESAADGAAIRRFLLLPMYLDRLTG
jgi:hypothetical protein